MLINLAFDNASGRQVGSVSSRLIPANVLLESFPNSTVLSGEYGDIKKMRPPLLNVEGVITETPPPTEEELAALKVDELSRYTDEAGLRKVEENLSAMVKELKTNIVSGKIKTKAEIDTFINAADLT